MFLFKLIRRMHIKHEASDSFRGFKIMAIKSPNNLLIQRYMIESCSCLIAARWK